MSLLGTSMEAMRSHSCVDEDFFSRAISEKSPSTIWIKSWAEDWLDSMLPLPKLMPSTSPYHPPEQRTIIAFWSRCSCTHWRATVIPLLRMRRRTASMVLSSARVCHQPYTYDSSPPTKARFDSIVQAISSRLMHSVTDGWIDTRYFSSENFPHAITPVCFARVLVGTSKTSMFEEVNLGKRAGEGNVIVTAVLFRYR